MKAGITTGPGTSVHLFRPSLVLCVLGLFLVIASNAQQTNPPVILSQPQSQFAVFGSSVSFNVSASNTAFAVLPQTSSGGATAATNLIATGQTSGTLLVDYDFFSVPDVLRVYYDGVRIFDSGLVSGTGRFSINYGPGASTDLFVIMNSGGNANTNTLWSYTASVPAVLLYQWRKDGTNVSGATSATYTIVDVQAGHAGVYSVLVSDLAGSVPSEPATLGVGPIAVYGNGLPLTSTHYTFVGTVNIRFQTSFTNGSIFYTLDGTEPSFTSKYFTGEFALGKSAVLRAVSYSSDFSQSALSEPIYLTIIPTYTLSAFTLGGGGIDISPPGGTHPSNTIISVIARPNTGWTFLNWLGDASGTNPSLAVTIDRDKCVEAVFGTTLGTTVAGNGTIERDPLATLYPYSTLVRLAAIPQPGHFFGVWGNAASGNVNPLYFSVTNPTPTISSLFAALGGNQVALTIIPNGQGRVTVSPRANSYTLGTNVTLAATPDAGQSFLGWNGDATGTQNPLPVVMNQSKVITANFTRRPSLGAHTCLEGLTEGGFRFTVTGEFGAQYQLEGSTNLIHWFPLGVVTNSYGRAQFTDSSATSLPFRLYRALPAP